MNQTKLFSGINEIEIKTETELLLLAALKAALFARGEKGMLKETLCEIRLDRFAFTDALNHQTGDVQILTDENNGNDVVRLKR